MRSSWWLVGLFGLVLGACFSSGGGGGRTTPENTSKALAPVRPDYSQAIGDPLGFLPIDSEAVFHIDANRVRQSMIWRQYEPQIIAAAGGMLQRFKDLCKIDPIAQIRSARVGVKDLGAPKPSGVFVVSGIGRANFLECVAKGPKSSAFSIDGDVIMGTSDGSTVGMQFVDASTLVMVIGPRADRKELERTVAAVAPLRSSPSFMEMFQTINSQTAMWFLINGNTKAFDAMQSMGFRPKAMFGSVGLVDGLSASMRIRLDTPAAAQQLVTTVQGQLGMVKGFVDRLDLSADANDAVLELGMTDAQLSTLVSMLGGMMGVNTAPPTPPTP